jgi:signal transduction histidine kinase
MEEPLSEGPLLRVRLDSVLNVLRNTASNIERADLCFLIARYFADRLKVDSALFYSEKIKQESEAVNYELGMGKYFLTRSYALYFRNIREPENTNKAIEIFKKYNEPFFSGFAYRVLAKQCLQVNDFGCARKKFHTAIDHFEMAKHARLVQQVYYELANSFSMASERDSVAFYLVTALQLGEKLNDPARIFMVASELGELYNITNDLENARRYLEYSLNNRTPEMSKILVRTPLAYYADVLLKQGEFSRAELAIKEYEIICEKLGDNWGFVMLNSLKGRYSYHKKNFPEAFQSLSSAYKDMDETDNLQDMKSVAYFLAMTEYELGQHDKAISHFLHALRLDDKLNLGLNVLDAGLYVSQSYEKKGNKDSALYYLRFYNHMKDSLLAFTKEKTVMELTARYETEKKGQQIKLLEREKELNTYQLRSQMDEIEKQKLLDGQKTQQLALLSQQNEISRLEASEKTLALQNQDKEMLKKQNEMESLSKESQLRTTIAAKESQQKKIAYAAALVVLVFGGIAFFRYRQSRRLGKQLAASLVSLREAQAQLIKTEKEKEADNIRVRISRDIHDEVGATLSGVALFSEIARERMKQHRQDDAQVYLDQITVNSKEMVDKMSDIVWAINPDNDSMDRIVAKLQSYAFNLCAGKGISLHINIDDTVLAYYPPMQVKRNLYLFMKEAINNAVKYSEGKNIFLSLQRNDDHIIAGIRDDGKGFDYSVPGSGNGLINMKARADSLDGELTIDTAKGMGTSIRLRFDFHPAGGQQATG